MSPSDTESIDRPRSRGRILGLFAVGGGAALAALFGRPERALADDGDPLILGAANRATSKTSIIGNVELDFAFSVENRSASAAGAAQFQTADPDALALQVEGVTSLAADHGGYAANIGNASTDAGAGALFARASGGAAVIAAISDASPSSEEGDPPPSALFGESTEGGVGVKGSGGFIGVDGHSPGGIGVHGWTEGAGIGGLFESFGEGVGLGVTGKAAFETVGAGTVPAGQTSAFVENELVTEASHITVALVSDPGLRVLQWVQRVPGSGFTVHLSAAPPRARPATRFTYFIAEHQEPQQG